PSVVLLVMGLFLDRIVAAVEAMHYPHLPPARRQPIGEAVWATLRLGLVALVLNILALPIYVFFPGVNLVLFYGINGYLVGREYFELVALRRFDDRTARAMRRHHALGVFLAGALVALLLTLPIINLAAPLIGAAFALHVFERWRNGTESR